ncbi:DBH-like monooxygenase protein 1 [Lineus longissimus]|uniref:DBH-like monooxygenase protein 1 n=1 Tax=Lineus longissimus TaxID=88925 RepID=UPI00315D0ED5
MLSLSAVFVSLAFLCARCTDARPETSMEYSHSVFLDEDEKYQLNWEVFDERVTFEVIVETTGYVGLGWSAKGGMMDADIITAWVDSQGQGYIQDRFGVGFMKPDEDTVSDIFLEMAMEMSGFTIIRFSRQLDTCDKEHDRPITTGTMRVIWSYGESDPASPAGLYYHSTNRGVKTLRLAGGPAEPDTVLPSDAKTIVITVDNFNVPVVDTFYECRIIELPKLDTKHHVIKDEPIITPGNEGVVHHMIVYPCSASFKPDNTSIGGQSVACEETMLQECTSAVFLWAVGAGATNFPEHVGYPLGGPDESKYARLEIHYDNPELRSDIFDNSGMRLTYTAQLRPHDMGVLTVGKIVSLSHVIPPQQEAFISNTKCNEKCFNAAFESDGVDEINVFGAAPHTHLAGRAIVTRHIRNGVELPYIVKDDTYDFNYQASVNLEPEAVIRRTDSVTVECTYGTMDQNEAIFGGLGTRDEMCISFLYYYPRISLSNCLSKLTDQNLEELFTEYHTVTDPKYDWSSLDAEGYSDLMRNNVSWKDAAGRLQEIEMASNYDQFCGSGKKYQYHPSEPAITINVPYKPAPSPCDLD